MTELTLFYSWLFIYGFLIICPHIYTDSVTKEGAVGAVGGISTHKLGSLSCNSKQHF
jgi:hypothetical protein